MGDLKRVLQFTTWLAPGLPEPFFDAIAAHVAGGLGCDHELTVEPKISGPLTPDEDRFSLGLTDIGFLCPPSVLWLTDRRPPSIELIPMAPVYDDPRSAGRPVYFSDVMVRADSGIESFDDLAGRRFGFNEPASLSGYVSVLGHLAAEGRDPGFFGEFRQVGSHREALARIASGDLDAAAIDTNVWQAWGREHPDQAAQLTSIAELGPNPVQPIVLRADLADQLLGPVTDLLADPGLAAAVAPFRVTAFAPIALADYEAIRPMLDAADRHSRT